jgi:thiamine pyridinylase
MSDARDQSGETANEGEGDEEVSRWACAHDLRIRHDCERRWRRAAAPHSRALPLHPRCGWCRLCDQAGIRAAATEVYLQITYNADYYDPDGIANDPAKNPADVYELDSVFLADFIQSQWIQPLPAELTPLLKDLAPLARAASERSGTAYGLPHWLCSNFLLYRAREGAFAHASTLKEVERVFRESKGPGLLMDLKGKSTLGEFYLTTVYDEYGSADKVLEHVDPASVDPAAQAAFPRMLNLEVSALGRDSTYHNLTGLYARDFAHGRGRVLVGYSESLYYTLSEAATCRPRSSCIAHAEIRVANWPTSDFGNHPIAWVDQFVVSRALEGPKLEDAIDFIRLMNSLAMYRKLLAEVGHAPRYLLPARADAYHDAVILKAAPLYPSLYAHIEKATAITGEGLNEKLRQIGKAIDGSLPASH